MWKTVKLGDIANLYQPKTITKKEMSEDGEYPVYGANGVIGKYHSYNHEDSQLVIGCRGSCGEVNVTQGKCWITGNAMVIQPKDVVMKEYLHYFLLQRHITNAVISGTAQPQITRKSLAPVEVRLPPLVEQQRIVAKLDAAFAEIDRAIEVQYQKYSAGKALEAQAMSGWLAENASQYDILTINKAIEHGWLQAPFDGNHGEIHPKAKDYVSSGVPFLMASDIRHGNVDLENCKFLSRALADTLRKGFAEDKDVLLTHKGTIGEVAILSCNCDYVMLTPQVTAYRVLDAQKLSREFLYYQFRSEYFQKQLREIAGIGTTRAYIGITRQRELNFYVPSIELQNAAVKLMQTVEPSVKELSRVSIEKIENLSHLKAAILAQELQRSEAA
ncbi:MULTISPECIES: restriction endonuclease subunit S [unclassified Aliiroseovarius]|uniref:restriction endonuclease subunit S n=1 Tax=unclassified Aliiroseovarius TaxID=2623558 RepID=UPI001568B2AE|nr:MULTISPECIES: restriction endonuclease subunit S [unclassified Aliiroseovarius]NRP13340.1 hypothetical protein [Aliiroseovarius sp. xm-d-517]NRP40185.1 hypothetical protein [Aliiroseovarius sp. xm-m-339-2]NRP61191.1 hypothetical protein [Aliiroseovarius sp. xm-a-151]